MAIFVVSTVAVRLRHFFHTGIDEAGQIVNVAAVAFGADAVRLPEDLDLSHAAPLIQSRRRLLSGGESSRVL